PRAQKSRIPVCRIFKKTMPLQGKPRFQLLFRNVEQGTPDFEGHNSTLLTLYCKRRSFSHSITRGKVCPFKKIFQNRLCLLIPLMGQKKRKTAPLLAKTREERKPLLSKIRLRATLYFPRFQGLYVKGYAVI